MAATLGG